MDATQVRMSVAKGFHALYLLAVGIEVVILVAMIAGLLLGSMKDGALPVVLSPLVALYCLFTVRDYLHNSNSELLYRNMGEVVLGFGWTIIAVLGAQFIFIGNYKVFDPVWFLGIAWVVAFVPGMMIRWAKRFDSKAGEC